MSENVLQLERDGKTVVIMAVASTPCFILTLEEEHLAKPEAQAVVKYCQQNLGLQVCMITGDNKHSAFKVAAHLGIPKMCVTYSAYPETKR